MAEMLSVEVVHALPGVAIERRFELAWGSSVADVLLLAARAPEFAVLDVAAAPVAIFGRRVAPEERLKDGDRVELLRPLLHDPKEARRRRVSRSGGS